MSYAQSDYVAALERRLERLEEALEARPVLLQLAENGAQPPVYQHDYDAGADLRANENAVLAPGETRSVRTGLRIAIPPGVEGQIRPRSGLSLRGVRVANAPGTIDSGFRGELCVIMHNATDRNFTVSVGDRIAQIVFARVLTVSFQTVTALPDSQRGVGGFGSTGV